jgi:hypothetical protein
MRCQVLTAANLKMTAFWDIVQCCLEEENRRLRGAYCLLYQNYKYAALIALMEAVRSTTLHGSISRWLPSLNYLQFDTSQVPGQRRSPQLTMHSVYDTVLLGQSYRTPRGAVTHGYGGMVE